MVELTPVLPKYLLYVNKKQLDIAKGVCSVLIIITYMLIRQKKILYFQLAQCDDIIVLSENIVFECFNQIPDFIIEIFIDKQD